MYKRQAEDPVEAGISKLLCRLCGPTFFFRPDYSYWTVFTAVRRMFRHGYTPHALQMYSNLMMPLGELRRDYRTSYAAGRSAMRLDVYKRQVDFGEEGTVFRSLQRRLGEQEVKVPFRRVEGGYQPAPVRRTQQEILNPAPFFRILRLPKPHCVVVRDLKRPFVQNACGARAFFIPLSKLVMDTCPRFLRQDVYKRQILKI